MHHVILWSAMRSGSTEFAKDIARSNHLKYVDEILNPGLSKYNPSLLNQSSTRLVLKLFAGHDYHLLQGKHCIVVLERMPSQRWCSLLHAKRTSDWTGRKRQACEKNPPLWFKKQHLRWFRKRPSEHLYLTFEEIISNRTLSLNAVKSYCKIKDT